MIEDSKRFKDYFLYLYETNNNQEEISFEEIFQTNTTRLEFINSLFEKYNNHSLSYKGEYAFESTIDYIYSFMNGEQKETALSIPKKYFNDSTQGSIIPTIKEVEYLLKLIEHNSYMYETIYANNPLYLELPDDTLNQNMTRILEIKRKNVAHLLGLTEHESLDNPDDNKNVLKKYFLSHVKDMNKYPGNTDSEKLLSWVTSREGKAEILKIHALTLEFIKEDRKSYPQSYNGFDLKSDNKSIAKFKERYKAATGLDFPLINYSRLLIKSINSLNFFKLANLTEIILDYNAPRGKQNEKDIFLVNRDSKKIHEVNGKYIDQRMDILLDVYAYAHNPNNHELKRKLLEYGINVNSDDIKDKLNIIKANKYLEKNSILPDTNIINDKIIEAINDNFKRDINLVGFGTDFKNDKEIPLDKKVIHYTHCDTSISLTAPELLGHYYKYGRSFFLDKIESKNGLLKVSSIDDELFYLKRMKKIKLNAEEDYNYLIVLKRKLKNNFDNYSNNRNKLR